MASFNIFILCVIGFVAYVDMAAVPTVTIDEVAAGIEKNSNPSENKVLTSMLNDYMALQFGQETDYTTGKRVLPTDVTIEDVDAAIADSTTDQLYLPVFNTISEVEKSGDKTSRSTNDGTWDPKLTPVLVLIRPNYAA